MDKAVIRLASKQIGLYYTNIYDDGFAGAISGEFYVINVNKTLESMSELILLFRFPKTNGVCDCRIVNYLKGYNKELFDKILYYDTETYTESK